jgi:ribosomal protein S18 acetylase RimI-like enzyme
MSSPEPIRTRAPAGLTLRRITDEDLPFLAGVYAATRQEELAPVPWTDAQKAAFLRWQFDNQHQYYQQYYPTCEFLVVETQGEAGERIGRLYVDRWPAEIRVVDIALLPERRRHGHGSALLRGILDEAAAAGLAVTIHVEGHNPAMGLYERLGFRHVDTNGVYHLMRWDGVGSGWRGVRP